jgi:Uri superfamily endonuclease
VGSPGSYVLVASVDRDTLVPVGRLGVLRFDAGFHCYSGSARGPGGLEARLARHLRRRKKAHWHVDYLLQHAVLVEMWKAHSTRRLECLFAQALTNLPGARVPAPGFGSSDCNCDTHLVYFVCKPPFDAFCHALQQSGVEVSLCRHVLQPPADSQRTVTTPLE